MERETLLRIKQRSRWDLLRDLGAFVLFAL